jgi:ankyrin repeat protein
MATLPERPHLDHLRAQARDLLRAWRAGNHAALARAAPHRLTKPQLAGAQLVIAREHGFASWSRLVREVERRIAAGWDDARFETELLARLFGRGWDAPQPSRALALAATRRRSSQALAWAMGDPTAVLPADVNAPLPPLMAPPLVYAAFSSLAQRADHRPRLVAAVERLLAAGADPNARLSDPSFVHEPLPVLYGAVARAACLETTRALLSAGAEPNDNESLYHATEQRERGLLAALVDAGARWTGTNALFRQLDHDDLPGLRQALDLGADPNESGPGGRNALHHALLRGRGAPFVALLLERGADALAQDDDGRVPASYAMHAGDRESTALLATRAPLPRLDPTEAFVAACAAADEPAARAHLAVEPEAIRCLPAHQLRLLPDQAQRGRIESVRLMLELGWPVDVRGDWNASALNQAAFRGDAPMVRLLLGHGARWHEPNGFGGDALGSCLHAASNQPLPESDHAAVFALLLADGAPAPEDKDALPEALQAVLGTSAD